MCINPSEFEGKTFGCRKCWQCRENAIQDWVGRCIAQSKTSTRAVYGTLTYGGGDHERATVLTYSDVQKFFKRLRKAKFKFKYLVAGEYGGTKGRAHWHVILFFDGPAPKIEMRRNHYTFPYWPLGFSYWDDVNASSARYVCKYIRKDADDTEAQAHFAMSKKPPIGSEYFARLAQEYVDGGIAPQDLIYRFAENRDRDGQMVKHMMHGATARDFLQTFIDKWSEVYGNDLWPNSDLVDSHVDKLAQYAPGPVMQDRRYGVKPRWLPFRECKLDFSETHNAYRTVHCGTTYWWWPLDQGNPKGEHGWHAGKTVVRWEQSDRHKDLVEQARLAKLERDSARSAILPVNGAKRPSSERWGKAAQRRLPMVGDNQPLSRR